MPTKYASLWLSKIYSPRHSFIMFPELWSSLIAIILLWADRLCSPKIIPACDTGKYASVIACFAISIPVLARIVVHTCILAKNSHQIRNQHLRFAQDRSNDPSVAYALAEIKFRRSYGRCHKRNVFFGRILFPYVLYGIFAEWNLTRA